MLRNSDRSARGVFLLAVGALLMLALGASPGVAAKGKPSPPRSAHAPNCTLKSSAHKSTKDEWASCIGVDASLSRAPAVGQTAKLTFRVSADVARTANISVRLPENLVFVSAPDALQVSHGRASGAASFAADQSRSYSALVKAVAPGSGQIEVRAIAKTQYGADAGADYVFLTSGQSTARSSLAIQSPRVGDVADRPSGAQPVRTTNRPYVAADVSEPDVIQTASQPSFAQVTECATGSWTYQDQNGFWHPSMNIWVRAWDKNPFGDTVLASGVTAGNGSFNLCFDNAETGAFDSGTADVYVTFTTENTLWRVGDNRSSGAPDFQWATGVTNNVGGGTLNYGSLTSGDPALMPGLHAFDEVNDAFLAVPGNVWDQTGGSDQKLVMWAPGSTDGTYESGGVVHLAANDPSAPITVNHELAHAIMYDVYEGAFPSAPNCNPHTIQGSYSQGCGWTEGFAEWFPAMVYNDPFFRWADGGSLNLENPTWGTSGWSNGDWPEGRVAGAMIDISDSANESPWDRRSDGSFAGQWSTFQGNISNTYIQFAQQGGYTGSTSALSTIYNNTIDYGFRDPLGNYASLTRPTPPNQSPIPPGSSNRHSYSYNTSTVYWSVIAERPPVGTDYDLALYDDFGLTAFLASSAWGGNAIDFVAVDSNSGGRPFGDYYPQVYQFSGTGNYQVELAQGTDQASPSIQGASSKPDAAAPSTAEVGSQALFMGSNDIVAVRDTFLTAGVRVYARIVPTNSGQNPELFLMTDAGIPIKNRSSASASSYGNPAGQAEQLSFMPSVSEWGGLVITNVAGSGSYNLYVDDSAPSGSVTINSGAAFTRFTNVSLALSASDPQTNVSQMQISTDGVFDTEPWVPYSASASATVPAGDGVKTVWVRFQNNAGMISAPVTDTITLDQTAPAVTIGAIGTFQRSNAAFTLSWSATDAGSGVLSYDVQKRTGTPTSALTPFSNVLTGTTLTSTSVSGSPGQTISLRVRARDNAGNVSVYKAKTTAYPLDDATGTAVNFTKLSGLTGQGYYLDTVARSTTANATLTAPASTVGIKRVGLLVTKGPSYGSIEVLFNGTSLGTFNTAAATVQKRQLISLPPFATATTGTLKVRVVSPGARVEIDGLGLSLL